MIQQIVPAITPEHILDIKLLKDSLDIFLQYLMDHSDITVDIKNIFDSKKIPIYEEFVKIYINNIYRVLNKSEHNEALYVKLKNLYRTAGYDIEDIDLGIDAVALLKKDYILTNKDFKASKGTPRGMKYVYDIIIHSGIQKDFLQDNVGSFKFTESGNLFEYKIEGTMVEEVYEHFVKPLVHPVGWAYLYQRTFYSDFTDYFNLEFIFIIHELKVKCMNGFLFEEDDYVLNLSHTGEQLVESNKVIFIDEQYIGPPPDKVRHITVYFESGETLQSIEYPRSLKLYNIDGSIKINYDTYDGNCGLYIDYTVDVNVTTTDDMKFVDTTPLASTTGKMNVIGAQNLFIGNFIIGDQLVNKNTSVTYQNQLGVFNERYTKKTLCDQEALFDIQQRDFDSINFCLDSASDDVNFWDMGKLFDRFNLFLDSGPILNDDKRWDSTFDIFGDKQVECDSSFFPGVSGPLLNYQKNTFLRDKSAVADFDTAKLFHDVGPVVNDNIWTNEYPAEVRHGTFYLDKHETQGVSYSSHYSYDGTNQIDTSSVGGWGGKTAADDFEITQILVKEAHAEKDFVDAACKLTRWDASVVFFDQFLLDSLDISRKFFLWDDILLYFDKFVLDENDECEIFCKYIMWDTSLERFDQFLLDKDYVNDEIEFEYSHNMWDTDLVFNFFKVDSLYERNGVTNV